MKDKCDIVTIDWVDSCSYGGWKTNEEIGKFEPAMCQSVGFVERSDKDMVVLSQSRSLAGARADQICIPRSCVKKITKLR